MESKVNATFSLFDLLSSQCEEFAKVARLREDLHDAAEQLKEFASDGHLDGAMEQTTQQRIINVGKKCALLSEGTANMMDAIKAVKSQVIDGQHQLDVNALCTAAPNFHDFIGSDYRARVPPTSLLTFTGSSLSPSPSPPPSSSSSSSFTLEGNIHWLSHADAARFERDEYVKALRAEMGISFAHESISDDDIQMIEEQTLENLKAQVTCQISQMLMKDPVKSKTCSHTFDKDSIIGMIKKNSNKATKCPIGGCSNTIHQGDLEPNIHHIRKLKKYRRLLEKQRKEAALAQLEGDEDMMVV